VASGWVDGALAGGAFAVGTTATVLDPFSALLSNGLGWAMEYAFGLAALIMRPQFPGNRADMAEGSPEG
jgi:hypothetical protein